MNKLNYILLAISCCLLAALVFVGLLYFSTPTETAPEVATPNDAPHDETVAHTHDDEEDQMHATAPADEAQTLLSSPYYGAYSLQDAIYGTLTTVTLSDTQRTITSNALPNHETGAFPGPGNPNEISAQDETFTYPRTPTYTGSPTDVRNAGVGINGIPFEPGTAEQTNCDSGEMYRVEGIQDTMDLGLDMNNAHVQPTGLYHYHGTPEGLVDFANEGNDLVHIGFAPDGHMMYYSLNGTYEPSYKLSSTLRTGTGCITTGPGAGETTVEGTSPDGFYTSDWVYQEGLGDLDECNGMQIGDEYIYLVTDTFPYVGRCVMGEAAAETGPGGGGAGPGGTPPSGGRPAR